MKILKIRGENLTSLSHFEINLKDPVFEHNGLFAITGPTGSGKSTLLDCICLALYGKTPRYTNKKSFNIGLPEQQSKHRISANDPRSLMSHGASMAMAEVEFVGQSQKIYKSSWRVRRAHGKSTGNLQKEEIELFEWNDKEKKFESQTSSKKTETYAKIVHAVGLEFTQFCRSVFLAQGEFDAFLKASGKERGGLLQSMTGTEIYEKLSKASSVRYKKAKQALQEQEALQGTEDLLSEEQATETNQQIDQLSEQVKHLEKDRIGYERKIIKFDHIKSLEKTLHTHQEEYEVCLEQIKEHHHSFEKAKTLKKLIPLVDLSQQIEESKDKQDHAHDELQKLQHEDRIQEKKLLHLQASEEKLYVQLNDLEQQWHRQSDFRQKIQQLDLAVSQDRARYKELSKTVMTKEDRVHQAVDALNQKQEQIKETQAALAVNERWLLKNEHAEKLYKNQSHWENLIRQFQNIDIEKKEAQKELNINQTSLQQLQKKVEDVEQELAQETQQLNTLQQAYQDIPSLSENLGSLQQQEDVYNQSIQEIEYSESLLQSIFQIQSDISNYQAQENQFLAQQKEIQQRLKAKEIKQIKLEAKIEEVEDTLSLAQQQDHLASYRHELEDGKPCPLCGSLEHPGVEEINSDLHDKLKARLADLKPQKESLKDEFTQLHFEQAKSQGHVADIQERLNQICQNLIKKQSSYQDLPSWILEQLPSQSIANIDIDKTQEKLYLLLDDQKQKKRELSTIMRQQIAWSTQKEHIQSKQNQVHQKLYQLQNQLDLLSEQSKQKQKLCEQMIQKLSYLGEKFNQLAAELNQYGYMEVADDLYRASQMTMKKWQQLAERWHKENTQAQGLKDNVKDEQNEEKLHAHDLDRYKQEYQQYKEQLIKQEQTLQFKEVERRSLDPQHERIVNLEHELQSVKTEQGRVQQKRQTMLVDKEERREQLAQHRVLYSELKTRYESLSSQLHHGLLQEKMSIQDLETGKLQLQNSSESDLDHLIETSKQLDQESISLKVRIDHLIEEIKTHKLELKAENDSATLKKELNKLQSELQTLQGELYKLQIRWQKHQVALAEQGALSAAYQRAKNEVNRWKVIHDLIGSSDGSKFRNFVQMLTLEMILEHANVYLKSLMPRYSLLPVRDSELEFQVVDQDFGDELRSLRSLSGGESFLISLALALGLSKTSAQDTPIDSLFIDEGFGTLDTQSLDTALSVLDNLQASGLQIGLISHVEGLAERIGIEVAVQPLGGGQSELMIRNTF